MKTQKQHQNDKLQKSSVLFLQLGLVLALFFVYTAIEYESVKKPFILAENTSEADEDVIFINPPATIRIEKKIKPKIEPIVQKQVLTKIITKPNDEPDYTTILKPTDSEPEINITSQINALPGGDTDPEEVIEKDIDFRILEDAPIFPGCEGLEKETSKACFSKEISKFINKKFNATIAQDLHMSGKQKIWVQFVVDKTGAVTDIKARAPHKRLQKEAIRVVKKIPQMTPGKQRMKPVNVKYTLPIVFQVD